MFIARSSRWWNNSFDVYGKNVSHSLIRMIETLSNNKRIAKNTILLYFRMIFMMLVQFYTSRVVLNTLGVNDYGIYNVVAGVVAMLSFLNSAMTSSTQRYITFELGKGNMERLCQVFSTSINIHIVISIFVVILGETVGLWFLYEKLVIPETRMSYGHENEVSKGLRG